MIPYVQERYGREQVAQIITFGTLQARGVLARRRPRAANAVWQGSDKLCKMVRRIRQPPSPWRAPRGRAEAAGRGRQRSGGQTRFAHCQETRRPDAPRLDPCRRIVIGDRPLSELVPL